MDYFFQSFATSDFADGTIDPSLLQTSGVWPTATSPPPLHDSSDAACALHPLLAEYESRLAAVRLAAKSNLLALTTRSQSVLTDHGSITTIVKLQETIIHDLLTAAKRARERCLHEGLDMVDAGLLRSATPPSPGSDSSWNEDDEDDDCFLPGVYSNMRSMCTNGGRKFMVTEPLPRRRRRHVHAFAHILQLGHMTLETGRLSAILISKDRTLLPSTRKKRRDISTGNAHGHASFAGQSNGFAASHSRSVVTEETHVSGEEETASPYLGWPGVFDPPQQRSGSGQSTEPDSAGYASSASISSAGYSSGASVSSQVSSHFGDDGSPGHKRRRVPRDPGAFVCQFPACSRVFDRQCDLSHHERCHRSGENLRHACPGCERRFLFPKDLRRHWRRTSCWD